MYGHIYGLVKAAADSLRDAGVEVGVFKVREPAAHAPLRVR